MGAGAIGCELLKSFALVGLGAGPSGGVTVADMDHVEHSNLSRQFLFTTQDIGVSAGPYAHLASWTVLAQCLPPATHTPTPSIFLFSSQRLKAEVAAEATHRLNSDLQVTPLTMLLDPTTEHIFGDNFFSRVDGVAAALDSFQARECLTLKLSPLFKAVSASLLILCPLAREVCGCSLYPLSEATAGGWDAGHHGPCFSVHASCD